MDRMLVGLMVVAGVLVAATVFGVLRRRRSGRVQTADVPDYRVTADVIGELGLGDRATLLQFSSAFCRPCVATRHLLADVAAKLPGVRHVDLDAESRLELVRTLGITSTPTTLLLDADGVVRRRATGVPRRHEVYAALVEVTGSAGPSS
jgi:thiol-disulfide isomerase/thioredoxin